MRRYKAQYGQAPDMEQAAADLVRGRYGEDARIGEVVEGDVFHVEGFGRADQQVHRLTGAPVDAITPGQIERLIAALERQAGARKAPEPPAVVEESHTGTTFALDAFR